MANNDIDDNQDPEVNDVFARFEGLSMSQKEKCGKKMINNLASDNPEAATKIIQGVENILMLKRDYEKTKTDFEIQRDCSKYKLSKIITDLDSTIEYTQAIKATSDATSLIGNVLLISGEAMSLMGYPAGQVVSKVGDCIDKSSSGARVAMNISEFGIETYIQYNIYEEVFQKYDNARNRMNEKGEEIKAAVEALNFHIGSILKSQRQIIVSIVAGMLNLSNLGIKIYLHKTIPTKDIGNSNRCCIIAYSAMNIGLSCWNLYEFKKKFDEGHYSNAAKELRRIRDDM